jgi:hypothetical protein
MSQHFCDFQVVPDRSQQILRRLLAQLGQREREGPPNLIQFASSGDAENVAKLIEANPEKVSILFN